MDIESVDQTQRIYIQPWAQGHNTETRETHESFRTFSKFLHLFLRLKSEPNRILHLNHTLLSFIKRILQIKKYVYKFVTGSIIDILHSFHSSSFLVFASVLDSFEWKMMFPQTGANLFLPTIMLVTWYLSQLYFLYHILLFRRNTPFCILLFNKDIFYLIFFYKKMEKLFFIHNRQFFLPLFLSPQMKNTFAFFYISK